MSISFKKLETLMKNRGLKKKDFRAENKEDIQNGKIPPAVLTKVFNGGGVTTDTINKLCKLLNCQPGDIMEYVDDEIV